MAALLGSVEHELPDHQETEAIEDVMREVANTESYPLDVAGPLRALRFLRGSLGDKVEAVRLFNDMLEWRSHDTGLRVDELRASVVGLDLEKYQEYYAAKPERPYLPGAFLGRSRRGALVVYYKGGSWDAEGVLQKFGDNGVLRHEVEKLEWIMWFFQRCSEEEKRVEYLVVLLDLEGASMAQLRGKSRQALIQCSKNLSNYYRDAVELTIIINTPVIFRAVWALITPFLTQRQQAKLRLLGSATDESTRAALHATIAPELLPASLGGTAEPDLWGQRARLQRLAENQFRSRREKRASQLPEWMTCCFHKSGKLETEDGQPLVTKSLMNEERQKKSLSTKSVDAGHVFLIDVCCILVIIMFLVCCYF